MGRGRWRTDAWWSCSSIVPPARKERGRTRFGTLWPVEEGICNSISTGSDLVIRRSRSLSRATKRHEIAVRTMEMFEAFGFSERVMKEAYWVNETSFWKPDPERPENIVRSDRIQDTEDGLSEFPHVILNQARVHDFFLDVIANSASRLEPDYDRRLVDMWIDPGASDGDDAPSHPVAAIVERIDADHKGELETVRARYVIGCDGAHSTVRRSMG